MGAQIGAARLLYGMGRSEALPQKFFGTVDSKRHVPRNNVLFVGGIALAGALLVSVNLFSYGLGAEMLNFGALIAFMGVNLAAFVRYFVREGKHNAVPPLLLTGLISCRRNRISDPCPMGASARGIYNLFFSLEKLKLESLDRW
jgi:amino acid transporter